MVSFKKFLFPKHIQHKIIKSHIPHFGLAEMKSFDLSIFKNAKRDSVEAFILSLSIAYNDSKDILWMSSMLNDNSPTNKNLINEESGQWRGMNHYVLKVMISQIHETIELIKRNKKIINSDDFKLLEKKLPRSEHNVWTSLKAVALKEDYQSSPLRKKLSSIRDKVFFHYDVNDNLNKLKLAAVKYVGNGYVSIGPSMEGSRYYFADLVFDGYKKELHFSDDDLKSLFREVSHPVFFLINSFIKDLK